MTATEAAANPPRLMKIRQLHSRIFAVFAVGLVLVAAPVLEAGKFPRECMLWVGYALVIVGAMGRAYCSAYIGGRKNDTIVRQGMFSVVRNPLYVFSFLATVGIGLQSGMLSVLVLLAGAYAWYYPKVVAKEEAFLSHKFGESYAAYVREVPRWIPNWKLWHEPDYVEAMPKFIRKTLMDASIFFLAMPCFAIIHALHTHGILPVWLTLP
jgi:protein-S-isoprenylcysteine O-methyltransferase Ste14